MKTYKIFRREARPSADNDFDKRVRWHVVAEQVGTSRTDALKRFFGPGLDVKRGEYICPTSQVLATEDGWYNEDGSVFVPKRANCVRDWNGVPTLAWESGTVDFDHVNILGTFVPATS